MVMRPQNAPAEGPLFRSLPASAWRRGSGTDHMDHTNVDGAPRSRRVDLDPVGMGLLTVGTLLIMVPFMEASAGAWIWGLEAAGIGSTHRAPGCVSHGSASHVFLLAPPGSARR